MPEGAPPSFGFHYYWSALGGPGRGFHHYWPVFGRAEWDWGLLGNFAQSGSGEGTTALVFSSLKWGSTPALSLEIEGGQRLSIITNTDPSSL